MFTSVNDFLNEWKQEAAVTQKVLDVLTDFQKMLVLTSDLLFCRSR